uniref:Uncharacterized protein n=1 Tax=Oryza sativa subsp. japonica TaxID=39947 RepID=Q84YV8_ORYSJ|nr:hypothetical protein [Oryza sativa Japonica Group]
MRRGLETARSSMVGGDRRHGVGQRRRDPAHARGRGGARHARLEQRQRQRRRCGVEDSNGVCCVVEWGLGNGRAD